MCAAIWKREAVISVVSNLKSVTLTCLYHTVIWCFFIDTKNCNRVLYFTYCIQLQQVTRSVSAHGLCLDVMFWTACWSQFVSASYREKCAPGSGITLANPLYLDLLNMLCPTSVIIYLESQSYRIALTLLEDSDLPVVITCLQWSPFTTVRFQLKWFTIHVILIWGESLDGNRSRRCIQDRILWIELWWQWDTILCKTSVAIINSLLFLL